ncbi:MAG: sensor histidine kinase, partial [Actinomycetota bacterium]
MHDPVGTADDIELIASAAAVPMLIVDYLPIMERFQERTEREIRELLADEEELLTCLRLPRILAISPEWVALYGSPLATDAPDLPTRQFTVDRYPNRAQTMVDQLVAPFSGRTSIISEHVAPSVTGDVVVRSHWKAAQDGDPYRRIVIVDLDLTDLRETQRSLEDAVEAKDRMVATIAHELRNPVTSLVGFSSILDNDWDALDEDSRREMAALTAGQATDVANLLEDLVAAAAGAAVPVVDEPLDLDEVLAALDLEGVGVDVPTGLVVRGDALRIRQIIRNLVENARRYGGRRKALRAKVEERQVLVSVRDDGEGISSELAERLFQPLASGGASGSLGLG